MEQALRMEKFVIATGADHPRTFSRFPDSERRTMANVAQVDLEEAVRLYYRRVYHFCLHLCRNPADAADLTQHAYEMLARQSHQISDPGKVKSWLHTTAYRKFVDQHRRTSRFPNVELTDEHLQEQAEGDMQGMKVDADLALKALHELNDDLRAPLALFYLEDYSYKDIAHALELPVGTVMSRLYRGKQQLFKSLTTAAAS